MTRRALLIGLMAVAAGTLAVPVSAECTVEETTVLGEPAIVVENQFLRLRVRPTIGGRIDLLQYKPADRHLTSRTDGGVFVDRIWNYANADVYRQWMTATYSYAIDSSPERVAIAMTGPGTVGPGERMTFEKTISIAAGSSAIRADYRFAIGQEAMRAMRVGLWWHNRLGVPQEPNTYYVPTTEGVKTAAYGAGGGGEYWWYDPARAWSAVVAESGAGVAAVTELGPLMLFYNWMGGDVAGLEWAFRSSEIPNGSAVETTAWLLPFSDMGRVAGASERVVIGLGDAPEQMDAPGELPLTVQLAAPEPRSVDARLTARRLPDGEPREVGAWAAELTPGQTTEHQFSLSLPQAGTWVISGEVSEGGETLADLFHEIVVGERSGQITIEPNEERIGRVGERFDDKIAAKGTGPADRHPSEEIVTPHVRWARPLAGGPLRALIVNDLLTGRETVELAQRLEMDYDAPTISTAYAIGKASGMFMADVSVDWALDNMRALLEENTYDVILVGGMSAELYPDDVVAMILDQVRAGAGLVWANPNRCSEELWQALPLGKMESLSRPEHPWRGEAEHYLTTGIPWEALPPTEVCRYTDANGADVLARAGQYPLLAVKDLGEGRVVGLGYNTSWQGPGTYSNGLTPWIQFAPTKFDYWEYYHSLLARCMLWAARREPQTRIAAIAVEPPEAMQGGDRPELRLAVEGAAGALHGELRLVDEFGRVAHSAEVEVAAGESIFPLPEGLSGGLYLVDLILRDGDGATVDWGSASFTVVPRIEVTELTLPDEIYRGGDTVEAVAMLAAIEPAPAQTELVASLTDAHGRVMARVSQQAQSSGEATIALEMPEPLATTAALRVEVREGDTVLDADERTILTMPEAWYERRWEPWLAAMWGGPAGAYSREYLANLASERVRRLGIQAYTTSANWLHDGEQRNAFEHGFQAIPINIVGSVLRVSRVRDESLMSFEEQREQYTRTGDKRFLERPYSLSADETRQMVAGKIAEVCEATARYRPVGYNCGDELSVTHYVTPFDYDFSPPALAEFRTWLQSEYETLAALNAEWETDFAAWDQVVPMTADEVRDRGNYAPWADHRTFMEISYADFFRFVHAELQSHDPGARVGISGSQAAEAYGGYDWWRLTDALDFGQTYDHKNTGEMHRSFHDMLTAPWWGYAQTDPALSHRLWRRLFNDSDGGSYYTYSYVFWPDYTWTASTADAIEHLDDIQGGLARLLDACAERAADVIVHYSHPSIHGAWITGGQTVFSENRAGWVQAIEDSGMQMRFLSYEQLEEGDLTDLAPAVFVLPYSVALSDREIAEIEAYVRAGGTVVADARTGLMDEHCAIRPQGALDELFGIRRASVAPGARRPEGPAAFARSMEDCDPTGLTFEGFGGEEGLALTTGQALGEMAGQPALIVNHVGEGRAVLLNLLLDSYGRRRELGVEEPLRRLVAEVLELAGATPPIRVEVSGGHHVYLARYRDGGSSYVGVVRDTAEGGAEVTLDLGAPDLGRLRHVYDLREGRHLGRRERISTAMGAGECKVFSLLPYEVEGVNVRVREERRHPGEEVEYLVSPATNAQPGLHVYRVEVNDPTGDPCAWYGTQLTAERGVASGEFRLALNDEPGAWTIRATDVATGVTGEARVMIEEE